MQMRRHFERFLGADAQRLHFAAHSHHPWPDVSFDAHQQAWLDAARLADLKWDKVFGEVIPQAQRHVAAVLGLPDPRTVCFAPSTHELVMRLFSGIERRPLRVLTTDSEFHSFARQLRRLEEAGQAVATRVAVEPFATFRERFAAALARGDSDVAYLSQCFFNTGFLVDGLDWLAVAARGDTLVVVDGYHGYMAAPTDLSRIAGRVFYVAGGYKYAMCGEGACFMHCPPGAVPRPVDTGWFAGFGHLSRAQDPSGVPYPPDGQRFMGATYDPTPLYRLNAVMALLGAAGVSVAGIRSHVVCLQQRFAEQRDARGLLPGAELLPPAGVARGNFLTFRHASARAWYELLLQRNVVTDYRDDRLRIGFGLYHEASDVDQLIDRLHGL